MWFDKLTTNRINKLPFVLSKLFTRRLKGGIEKQERRRAMGIRVAAMKRSVIEDGRRDLANDPEYASLLPGYGLRADCKEIQRQFSIP